MRILRGRALFLLALLAGCSAAPPPPQPPYPWADPPRPAPAGAMYVEAPDELPEQFTLVLAREYGMSKFEWCRFELNANSWSPRAKLSCARTGSGRIAAEQPLEVQEIAKLVELARNSNLYGADHIGADLTPGDGWFESLRVSPAGGGAAAVLVTTWNRSFVEAGPRRELLEILRQIELRLLETAEKGDRPA